MAYKNNKRVVKKNKQRKRLFVSFLVLCVLLFIGFLFLMRIDALQINTITIEGNSFVQTEDIRTKVEDSLLDSTLFVIPGSNTLFISKQDIRDSVVNSFTEVESISLDRIGFTGLNVLVQERNAQFTYCQDVCYSFDGSGFLFKQTELASTTNSYVFSSKKGYSLGDTFLSKRVVSELTILLNSINKKGLTIERIEEQSDFTLSLITKSGTRLLLPKTDSYDELYSLFVKLLNTEEFKLDSETGDFKTPYEYINMQFGKKVFSCLKGEECASNYK